MSNSLKHDALFLPCMSWLHSNYKLIIDGLEVRTAGLYSKGQCPDVLGFTRESCLVIDPKVSYADASKYVEKIALLGNIGEFNWIARPKETANEAWPRPDGFGELVVDHDSVIEVDPPERLKGNIKSQINLLKACVICQAKAAQKATTGLTKSPRTVGNKATSQIEQYIAGMDGPVTIGHVAKECGVSPAKLRKSLRSGEIQNVKFFEQMGKTYVEPASAER